MTAADGTALWVPAPQQWMSTTKGRATGDAYSWMQAVHWAAQPGRYTPRRSHGPRFGTTTVALAQRLARLSPCRPGVSYLARCLKVSERTVQYHLAMLREAGLLAYVVRGTRTRGSRALASEFARTVPPEFDRALGIRTTGEGAFRRMTGMAEAGREEIARLARTAARTARARRRARAQTSRAALGSTFRGPADGMTGCTPRVGGSVGSPSADLVSLPSEKRVVPGTTHTTPPKAPAVRRGALNRVGRRFQLARELSQQVGWLARTPVPRLAWVLRHVSDAGWSACEVQAWLHLRGAAARRVHRPSGLLATLIAGAESGLDTADKRAAAVAGWRDSRQAARQRHEAWQGAWQAPRDPGVLHLVTSATEALAGPRHGVATPATPAMPAMPATPATPVASAAEGPLELSDGELDALRATARGEFMSGETTLITTAVETWGLRLARQVYGGDLVSRALRLTRGTGLMAVRTVGGGAR
ncbi:transcriptional regulator [Streptomyces sp. IBSNAI002]|uniref:transcriptional regulator n=1 Tax=Streptomyces sp. IBSNAI002 TaxID=3457500 RepID=UPI003FD3BDAA